MRPHVNAVKIALLQINPLVGDLAGNATLIAEAVREAGRQGADLAVTPELALVGYLPRDLAAQPRVRRAQLGDRDRSRTRTRRPAARAGRSARTESVRRRATAVQYGGAAPRRSRRISGSARRSCPPTTCSTRTATSSRSTARNSSSCAAIDSGSASARTSGTIATSGSGAATITTRSTSWCARAPTRSSTCRPRRFRSARSRFARRCSAAAHDAHIAAVVYVNQFGGNDDLVFDGRSLAFDANGEPSRAAARSTPTSSSAISTPPIPSCRRPRRPAPSRKIWQALVLGTRDYVRKCGFSRAVRRLVGRHRLGADRGHRRGCHRRRPRARRAHAVALLEPGQHRTTRCSSPTNLGIETLTLPIEPAMRAMERRLAERVRRHRARRDRREHPGAHPRQPADGAVEQARRAASHDRATSRNCRSATARCTATCRADWRSSRTCRRRWCTGWRGG